MNDMPKPIKRLGGKEAWPVDWRAYYNARVQEFEEHDHLRQVGHTVNGAPIPDSHFFALRDQITLTLALGPTDTLLDLCCGNGLFTRPLAARVRAAVGADISEAMIAVARADHAADNLEYLTLDARCAADLASRSEAPFSRVLIYGAWQHFDIATARQILVALLTITASDAHILLGFVPDIALKERLFDTPSRRAAHAAHVAAGTDMFGTWWDRATLSALCRDLGLKCLFSELPPQVHAARYRFNALLSRA